MNNPADGAEPSNPRLALHMGAVATLMAALMGCALAISGLPALEALPLALMPLPVGYWWSRLARDDDHRRPPFWPLILSGVLLGCMLGRYGILASGFWLAVASVWWAGLAMGCSLAFAVAMTTDEDLKAI